MITDAERFCWLFSSHTNDELQACSDSGKQPDVTPQDECLARLASWYCTLEESRATIDAAMVKASA